MKATDQMLQRLLDAAGKAPSEAVAPPPLDLQTRVLAHWRAGKTEDESISVFAFFRRAVLGASLVLALSAAWSLAQLRAGSASDEAARLDYQIQMSLNP
jgi:hypothetical protein